MYNPYDYHDENELYQAYEDGFEAGEQSYAETATDVRTEVCNRIEAWMGLANNDRGLDLDQLLDRIRSGR